MENSNTFYKMTKTAHYIDCPHDWIGVDDYSSHLPMLWLALQNTDGNVQELGSGKGSTPMLMEECKRQKRFFGSYENDGYFSAMNPLIVKVKNYMDVHLFKPNILFIDSAPGEQRKDLIELHKDNADVIILHDTEDGAQNIYGIREVLNSFKYRLNYYPKGNPGTTALSNKIDVTQWI